LTTTANVTRALHGMGLAPAGADGWPRHDPRACPCHDSAADHATDEELSLLAALPRRLSGRITISAGPCRWLALPPYDKDGYAKLAGKLLHRLVYLELVGEIPAETPVLDHVAKRGCVSRACVWVPHLEPVTVRINTLRGNSFSARNARKDECDHGHEFDLFNTYWWNGRRCCRACNRAAVARYKARFVAAGLSGTVGLAA
jgi:hypothetical protein